MTTYEKLHKAASERALSKAVRTLLVDTIADFYGRTTFENDLNGDLVAAAPRSKGMRKYYEKIAGKQIDRAMAKLGPLLDAAESLRTYAGPPHDHTCAPEYDAAWHDIVDFQDAP